ncbi:MAG: hypothetical protein ACR2NW_09875 [Thermodesulfobacteriota bacterium]
MAEEKHSSQNEKPKAENKHHIEKKTKEKKNKKLDSYDLILLDTFPASDSVAKY